MATYLPSRAVSKCPPQVEKFFKPELVSEFVVYVHCGWQEEGQVLESKEEMAAHLRSDKVTKFKPLGNKIDEFKGPLDTSFEIYYVDCATEPSFQDYHSKLQPWIMFYIDAASYIGKH